MKIVKGIRPCISPTFWSNILWSVNYIMLTSLDEYFSTTIFSGWILHGSLFTQFLSMMISWRHILQGRVATHLRCGKIFNYHFTANISMSLTLINWVGFNVPLNTLQVISGTGFTGQMTQPTVSESTSTKGSSSPKDRLQSHQVHLTVLHAYTCIQFIHKN